MLIVDTPLETDRLLLRPFRLDDLDALHDLRTRSDVLRHLYWPPATVEQIRDVIDQRLTMTKLAGDNDCLVLAVEPRDTGRMVGEVDLRLSSLEHRHAELGVILHPDVQGQGFAAEAASACSTWPSTGWDCTASPPRPTRGTQPPSEPSANSA
jgi:RimJ/RimL family protein N-acetyltransferase